MEIYELKRLQKDKKKPLYSDLFKGQYLLLSQY